jgi:hypothetical protein
MNLIRELSEAWIALWGISSLGFFGLGMQSFGLGYSVENHVLNASSFEELMLPYVDTVLPDYLQAIIYLLAALFCISIVMVSLRIVKL